MTKLKFFARSILAIVLVVCGGCAGALRDMADRLEQLERFAGMRVTGEVPLVNVQGINERDRPLVYAVAAQCESVYSPPAHSSDKKAGDGRNRYLSCLQIALAPDSRKFSGRRPAECRTKGQRNVCEAEELRMILTMAQDIARRVDVAMRSRAGNDAVIGKGTSSKKGRW